MENSCKTRQAIAMIELIFALVVIGLVLISAPQLIQTAAKSSYIAMQQEGISEAAAKINMIMGYHWDEKDTDKIFLDPILTTTSGHIELDANTTTLRRNGTPLESYRAFVRSDNTKNIPASTILGAESGDKDDIDDFNNETIHLLYYPGGLANADYIEKGTDINITTKVEYEKDDVSSGYQQSTITYIPFRPESIGTTNIKGIIVTLTSNSGIKELEKSITFKAFSCNIGGYKLEERNF
jgi:hypothetical protein